MKPTIKIILVANTDWYLFNFKLSFISFLIQKGYEVVLVSPKGDYSEKLQNLGYRHIDWSISRQSILPWGEIPAILKLINIYRDEKPALVHHFTIKPVLYGSLAANVSKVPSVCNAITGRGYALLANEWKAKFIRPFVKLLYKVAFLHPNIRVIFENDSDQSYFIHGKYIRQGKSDLIEGVGVNVDWFMPTPEPEGMPVVSYVGRLLWDKGIGVLIEATRILKKKYSLKVLLAGIPDPGNPSSIPEEIIQSWVNEGLVEWQGWQDDVKAVYNSSNIIVLPSFFEGVPTVLLEAAACGRAIVASDIPGNRIVVEDQVNGLIVPPSDSAALADAIEKLILDTEKRRLMGIAGRERILKSFTTNDINEKTYEVYKKILMTDDKS